MMKSALLLVVILYPMVFCGGPYCPNLDSPDSAEADYIVCDCGEIDLQQSVTRLEGRGCPGVGGDELLHNDCGCNRCELVGPIMTDSANNECVGCTALVDIAEQKTDAECCSAFMEYILETTDDDSKLLDSYDHHHYNEDCVSCEEVRELVHNTGCPVNKPKTCYLHGGGDKGNYGYGSEEWYSKDYNGDYSTAETGSYGSYDNYGLCDYYTVAEHIKMIPDYCMVIRDYVSGCSWYGQGTEQNCPVCTNKCGNDYILKDHCPKTVCPDYPIYDSNSALTTEGTADNAVETVGWVLIAVSGVLFLVSIAFFTTGRSERKAAAENRMAGHGVMA